MRYRRRTTPPRPSDLRKKDGGGTFGRSNSSAVGFEPDRRHRQCIARAGSIRLALPFRIIFPRYSTDGRRYGRRAAGSVSQPQSTRRYGLGPKPILGRTGPSPRLRSQCSGQSMVRLPTQVRTSGRWFSAEESGKRGSADPCSRSQTRRPPASRGKNCSPYNPTVAFR